MEEVQVKKSRRGFASLPEEKRKAISRLGGIAAHKKGTAHEFTPEEARVAGRKGGYAVAEKRALGNEFKKKGTILP